MAENPGTWSDRAVLSRHPIREPAERPTCGVVDARPDASAGGPEGPVFEAGGHQSDDPALLAAMLDLALDRTSLAEDLAFGFRIGRRTLFEGVCRRVSPSGLAAPSSRREAIDALCGQVAGAVGSGAALELTGGVDSRLVLALSMRAGVVPKAAITLGKGADIDVTTAAAICRRLGIRHHVVPISPVGSADLWDDTREFVRGSGFASNATSYGWLPSAFRALEPIRDGQMSGAGGEMAAGFYRSPLDHPVFRPIRVRAWIRFRLARSGSLRVLDRIMAGPSPSSIIEQQVAKTLGEMPGPWLARIDQFYEQERLENWGRPVLRASSRWYRVYAPLMSHAYSAWAATLGADGRRGRASQIALIAELAPTLLEFPINGTAPSAERDGLPRQIRRGMRRILGSRGESDLGGRESAMALAGDSRARDALLDLASERGLGLRPSVVEQMLTRPAEYPHELGALWTAAIGRKSREAWKAKLSASRTRAGGGDEL